MLLCPRRRGWHYSAHGPCGPALPGLPGPGEEPALSTVSGPRQGATEGQGRTPGRVNGVGLRERRWGGPTLRHHCRQRDSASCQMKASKPDRGFHRAACPPTPTPLNSSPDHPPSPATRHWGLPTCLFPSAHLSVDEQSGRRAMKISRVLSVSPTFQKL